MRHAKAANPAGAADHERPLATRGHHDAVRAGKWLAAQDWIPDLVVCSDAARTRQTADLVVEGAGFDVPIRPLAELYTAGVADVLGVLRGVPEHPAPGTEDPQRVLLVGHEPTTSASIATITGQWKTCPTAAIAVVELAVGWGQVDADSGELAAFWTPR